MTCGAIIEKRRKILLTKRNVSPYKDYWCLPGGHINWGEKVKEAIKREGRKRLVLILNQDFLNIAMRLFQK